MLLSSNINASFFFWQNKIKIPQIKPHSFNSHMEVLIPLNKFSAKEAK